MSNKTPPKTGLKDIDHHSLLWKFFLLYDSLMMILIVLNLLTLALQALIMSAFGGWVANLLQLSTLRADLIQNWYPIIQTIDFYFISYLITELALRWLYAIVVKQHRRWWYFPFIHWYEVIAIVPMFRFFRLARAGIIAYRLHELGYQVIPKKLLVKGKFYYDLILEELSDRIVLTVIKGVEVELETSAPHNHRIHAIIDQHRPDFAQTLAEILQQSVSHSLIQQQSLINQEIGRIVNQSIENTPELRQLLRLLPIVGHRLEQQIQSIGQRIGENISDGLVSAFSQQNSAQQLANPVLGEIALQISQLNLNTPRVNALIDSIVAQTFATVREQVKIKQWQDKIEKNSNSITNST